MPRFRSASRGFTLVELLVVIAIIGVLVALLLPAIQAARESARRSECSNKLKQIGTALHNYHDSFKKLPAGFIYRGASTDGQPEWGWAVAILPYLEQPSLYESLEWTTRRLAEYYMASGPADKKALLQTPLPCYRCPSDIAKDLNDLQTFGSANHFSIATSNYVACAGTTCPDATAGGAARTRDPLGLFFGNSWLSFRDILDGASNTLAAGERNAEHYAAVWAGVGRNDTYGNEGTARTLGRSSFFINFDFVHSVPPHPENQGKCFASYHPGGANFVLADASVRFISQNTNTSILAALGQRADGIVVKVP